MWAHTAHAHARTPLCPTPPHPTSLCRSLSSYFLPWTSATVSTFDYPLQTIRLDFGVVGIRYICAGEFCSPGEYFAVYNSFILFWYREVNNGGFAPYPNQPIPSADPGMFATCVCALGSEWCVPWTLISHSHGILLHCFFCLPSFPRLTQKAPPLSPSTRTNLPLKIQFV
jgi:hypothetical protein